MERLSSFRSLIRQDVARLGAAWAGGGVPAPDVDILTEIIVGVAGAKEEGYVIAPAVYLCSDLATLLAAVNGTNPIAIGEGEAKPSTARVALKSCVPLGEGRQWAVFLALRERRLSYGVFCTDRLPLRITSFEFLRLHPDLAKGIIGVTRLGDSVVEVRGGGDHHYFEFSGSSDLNEAPIQLIRDFVRAVTRDVEPKDRPQFEAFYYRVGVDMLRSGHGTLAAVMDHRAEPSEVLCDGIWLEKPVRIDPLIHSCERIGSDQTALDLLAVASLIVRMSTIDGITVFATDGSVRGYNCFARDRIGAPAARDVIGGARRRAFDILVSELGDTLIAALYRSQDGAGQCIVKES